MHACVCVLKLSERHKQTLVEMKTHHTHSHTQTGALRLFLRYEYTRTYLIGNQDKAEAAANSQNGVHNRKK